MKTLTDLLQSNPYVVLTMFAVSLVSGIMGIVLGWKRFYDDYLSKTVPTPAWLIITIVILNGFALLFIGARRAAKEQPAELVSVVGKTFGVQQVVLDGYKFSKCDFDGSELVFNGDATFTLEKCNFKDFRMTFGGKASIALGALNSLYRDPAFRPL